MRVDDGFALYESAAIVDYLEHAYPRTGRPLYSGDVRAAAIERRLVREADQYLATAMEHLVDQILFTPQAHWDAPRIAEAREAFTAELALFESSALGTGAPGAADFTVYPLIALALRMEKKKPDLAIAPAIGPRLTRWMKRIEALPYFDTTFPPHWRKK